MKRRVLMLTKSAKRGYCVAGFDFDKKDWIRIVNSNDDNTGSLTAEDIRYIGSNGREYQLKPLDVFDVELSDRIPFNHQTENRLKEGNVSSPIIKYNSIKDIFSNFQCDNPDCIFYNTENALYEDDIRFLNYSLCLIEVTDLILYKSESYNGDIKTKCKFMYNSNEYKDIRVTDKEFFPDSNRFAEKEELYFDKAYLVMSLPAKPFEFNNKYYKLAAKIFIE